MQESGNRREASRIARNSRLLYREYVLDVNKPTYEESALIDISPQGLSFSSVRSYAPGDVLEVRLMLDGWDKHRTEFYMGDPRRATDPLVALITVANVGEGSGAGYKIGGTFSSIDESHRNALERYLAKFEP